MSDAPMTDQEVEDFDFDQAAEAEAAYEAWLEMRYSYAMEEMMFDVTD